MIGLQGHFTINCFHHHRHHHYQIQLESWQFVDTIPNVMVARLAKFDHGIRFRTAMNACQHAMKLIR